jgi:hypothetical protein
MIFVLDLIQPLSCDLIILDYVNSKVSIKLQQDVIFYK